MGTHPNGPSHLWDEPSKSLKGLILSAPRNYLGQATVEKFPHATEIPILFKVLSIAKALPLQAHPDKALAEQLHRKNSKTFVDSNHKPEIAVAISDGFRGFVGFLEPDTILRNLETIPELKEVVGDEQAVARFSEEKNRESLKAVFSKLLNAKPEVVVRSVTTLIRRLEPRR